MPKLPLACLLLAIFSLPALAKELRGTVWLLGPHNEQERSPAVGAQVSLQGIGNRVRSAAGGEFRLSLPDGYEAGEDITLVVEQHGYQVFQPAGGRTKIPKDLAKQAENIELLPLGSKRFWADAQIEALIQNAASAPKPLPQAKDPPPDFNAYLQDWAKTHGLDEKATLAEIQTWAKKVQAGSNDLDKLGLAAFAQKNFRLAEKLYSQSAESKVGQLKAKQREVEDLTQATVAAYRRAGDAAYFDNRHRDALTQYQKALSLAPQNTQPRLWAAVSNDLAKAQWALGLRSEGAESGRMLAAAAGTFKQLLAVHSRAESPKDWAMTQNNLGNALGMQGIRTGGEAALKLLGEAVAAYREALTVRTRQDLPQDWAMTQNNLGAALQEQGIRTGGEAGSKLLGKAVAAYREALTVFTRQALPQEWAATQNNLGTALQDQDTRTGGEAGSKLLGDAVAAYHEALMVRTRQDLPQDWATTQNNLGAALRAQGTRADGEAGLKLLGDAVAAYREALTVRTRQALPQQWAETQNNLGNALRAQGTRAGGEAGPKLLGEAVAAYREALKVFTRQDLPQDWAMTQNNLGLALQAQGTRTGGEAALKLLGDAAAAYRSALEIRTRADLPAYWQRTARNLAEAYALSGQAEPAAALYRELYTFDPGDAKAYQIASLIYHEILFDYPQAYALNQDWLNRHPDDLSVQLDFAEKQFTTGRFAEAVKRLDALLAKPGLPADTQVALRALDIANAAALGQPVDGKLRALRTLVAQQPEEFKLGWSSNGTRHFIETDRRLEARRGWLLKLLAALEAGGRAAMSQGLDDLASG